MGRPESKCGKRKGMRELRFMGIGRIMAVKIGAAKHARERTRPKLWLWSKVEVKDDPRARSEVLGGWFMWTWTSHRMRATASTENTENDLPVAA